MSRIGVGNYAVDTVRAVSAVDPCAPQNIDRVCAAQWVLGIEPDGKWGTDTYIAALGWDPQARPGCSPRPAWWPRGSACTPSSPMTEASRALAEMERMREGSGTMSGIRLNGALIPGHGLGQDATPPPAAPPVGVPDPAAASAAAGAAADASGKAALAAQHTWAGWWHALSTPAKVGIVAAPVAVVGTGIFLATRGKKKGRRKSKRGRR